MGTEGVGAVDHGGIHPTMLLHLVGVTVPIDRQGMYFVLFC